VIIPWNIAVTARPRIALIHAVTVAMQPIEDAFVRLWPEAERVNLLDDALSVDRAKMVDLTPVVARRIGDLAEYAMSFNADAILYTCSAFGPAIDAVAARLSVPVLKPNDAMFEAAIAQGQIIGMVATFEPSIASMTLEFQEAAARHGSPARLRTTCVAEAMAALRVGDANRHHTMVAEAARSLGPCDAIMLAQFSTSRAADAVAAEVSIPVLTSPAAAVVKLRRLLNIA
jgi:Asp/Glu/hydantoin racemase